MEAQKINISVLYKDDRLIFVDKPSGIAVHRGWAKDRLTLADIVRDDLVGKQVFALSRLDRATSGIVGFALDSEMARLFQQLIFEKSLKKEYLALVRGPLKERILLSHPIPRSSGGERVPAETEFIPLKRSGRWTLVKAIPLTGRLHQIRRHLKHLSLPVVGDTRYGKGEINRYFREEYKLHRLALHASSLGFSHPDNDLSINLESPLPLDLERVFSRIFKDEPI